MTTTHPPFIAFQCEDSTAAVDLIIVNSDLFTGAGNIPGHNWFAYTFGGRTRLPDPISRATDGMPVYYLPIPRAVFVEMLRLLRLPLLMDDAWDHVPLSLKQRLRLGVWRAYLERYNFVVLKTSENKRPKVDSAEEIKTKKIQVLQSLEEQPAFAYVRRLCEALINEMRIANPDLQALLSGQKQSILCHFVNTYNNLSSDGILTYYLTIAGDPPVPEPANPAFELGMQITSREDLSVRTKQPTRKYVKFCLLRALDNGLLDVSTGVVLDRKSKAKRRFELDGWPAPRNRFITPGDHDVWSVRIYHRSGSPRDALGELLPSISVPKGAAVSSEEEDDSGSD